MYVVVGAGLSGLYAAFLLNRAGCAVVVLEAAAAPGGRMQTARDARTQEPLWERGAWRLKGRRTKAFVEALGGTVRPLQPRKRQEQGLTDEDALPRTFLGATGTLSSRDVFALAELPESRGDRGYHGVLRKSAFSESYDAGAHTPSTYYVVEEGWSFVIERLAEGLDIRYGCAVTSCVDRRVTYRNRDGRLATTPKAEGVILAIPPHRFPRNDLMLQVLKATVQSHALCHVWVRCDATRGHIDVVTPRPISQISSNPLKPRSDVKHVYAMDRDACFLQRLYQTSPKEFLRYLRAEFARAGVDTRPTRVEDVCFHEHGVHSWRPSTTFPGPADAARRAVVPDPLHRPWLAVAGEAFTTQQGWAEGALTSARGAVAHVRRQQLGAFRAPPRAMTTQMRFNGYAVRVPDAWYRQHPGGEAPLRNHRGEDITALFQNLHEGSQVAYATLFFMFMP